MYKFGFTLTNNKDSKSCTNNPLKKEKTYHKPFKKHTNVTPKEYISSL